MERRPRVAFVSGHIDPPKGYFQAYYEPLLSEAIAAGDSFVMGPAQGVDAWAFEYLLSNGAEPSRITVYLTEVEKRMYGSRFESFESKGGRIRVEGIATTRVRDEAMTRDSDYDILRYMTVEEQKVHYGRGYRPRVSATERNAERRRLLNQDNAMEDGNPHFEL